MNDDDVSQLTRRDLRLLAGIMRTDVRRQMLVTHVVLGTGIAMTCAEAIYGAAVARQLYSFIAAIQLPVTILIVAARYRFLALYSLIQKLQSSIGASSDNVDRTILDVK